MQQEHVTIDDMPSPMGGSIISYSWTRRDSSIGSAGVDKQAALDQLQEQQQQAQRGGRGRRSLVLALCSCTAGMDALYVYYLLDFLMNGAGFNGVVAGALLLSAELFIVITAPLGSFMLDCFGCKSAGQHSAWLLLFVPVLVVCFVGLWWVPPLAHEAKAIAYYLGALIVFNWAYRQTLRCSTDALSKIYSDQIDTQRLRTRSVLASSAAALAALGLVAALIPYLPSATTRLMTTAAGVGGALALGACAALALLLLAWQRRQRGAAPRPPPLALPALARTPITTPYGSGRDMETGGSGGNSPWCTSPDSPWGTWGHAGGGVLKVSVTPRRSSSGGAAAAQQALPPPPPSSASGSVAPLPSPFGGGGDLHSNLSSSPRNIWEGWGSLTPNALALPQGAAAPADRVARLLSAANSDAADSYAADSDDDTVAAAIAAAAALAEDADFHEAEAAAEPDAEDTAVGGDWDVTSAEKAPNTGASAAAAAESLDAGDVVTQASVGAAELPMSVAETATAAEAAAAAAAAAAPLASAPAPEWASQAQFNSWGGATWQEWLATITEDSHILHAGAAAAAAAAPQPLTLVDIDLEGSSRSVAVAAAAPLATSSTWGPSPGGNPSPRVMWEGYWGGRLKPKSSLALDNEAEPGAAATAAAGRKRRALLLSIRAGAPVEAAREGLGAARGAWRRRAAASGALLLRCAPFRWLLLSQFAACGAAVFTNSALPAFVIEHLGYTAFAKSAARGAATQADAGAEEGSSGFGPAALTIVASQLGVLLVQLAMAAAPALLRPVRVLRGSLLLVALAASGFGIGFSVLSLPHYAVFAVALISGMGLGGLLSAYKAMVPEVAQWVDRELCFSPADDAAGWEGLVSAWADATARIARALSLAGAGATLARGGALAPCVTCGLVPLALTFAVYVAHLCFPHVSLERVPNTPALKQRAQWA